MVEKSNTELHKLLKKHPAAKEYEFLFDCCRASFANTTILYPDDINAGVFYDLLQHHKLITHLYPFLKDKCEGVSDELLQRVQQALKQNKLHLLKLSGELVRLSKLFEENQIPWLSIKGPALSMQLYGDVAARQSGDLDILVNEADLEKAMKILTEAGYESLIDFTKYSADQIKFMRKYYRDISFEHSFQQIKIELHWLVDIVKNHPLNKTSFKEMKNTLIGNALIPVCSDSYNTQYLCLHGSRHGWYRLFWLWDFAASISGMTSTEIDNIVCLVKKNKLCKELGQAIALSSIIFGVNVSVDINQYAYSSRIVKLSLRYILAINYMDFSHTLLRMRYKLNIYSYHFVITYYYRRSIVFLMRHLHFPKMV